MLNSFTDSNFDKWSGFPSHTININNFFVRIYFILSIPKIKLFCLVRIGKNKEKSNQSVTVNSTYILNILDKSKIYNIVIRCFAFMKMMSKLVWFILLLQKL